MTTLSLLKSKEEFAELKLRFVFDKKFESHPDYQSIAEEYTNWSKGFPDFNPKTTELNLRYTLCIYIDCKSRDRLMNVLKFVEFLAYFDDGIEPARKARSAQLIETFINELIDIIESRQCDPDFTLGKRFLIALTAIESALTIEQKNLWIKLLKEWLLAHLLVNKQYWIKNEFIPIVDYYRVRSVESGWPILIFLMEYTTEYIMLEVIRNDEEMSKLVETVVANVLAIDDYFIFKHKFISNDITNEIMSYANDKMCSLQSAIDYHFQRFQVFEKQLNQLKNKILNNSKLSSNGLSNYIATISKTPERVQLFCQDYFKFENKNGFINSVIWDKLYQALLNDTCFDTLITSI